MNFLKISLPGLLAGLMAFGSVASAQDTGVRRPQAPKPCYTPAGSITCQPGPGVDVISLVPAIRGKKMVRLPGRTSTKPSVPVRRSR